MNPLTLLKLPFSSSEGWAELYSSPPSVARTFFCLLLPLSLLAPAMLVLAGHYPPYLFWTHLSPPDWQFVAALFLVAELVSVPLMAAMMKEVGAGLGTPIRFRDAFLLATVCAVPMYLSSLALGVPSLGWLVVLVIIGLLLACALLYHGMYFILKAGNPALVQEFAAQVFASGALVWAMLCAFLVFMLSPA